MDLLQEATEIKINKSILDNLISTIQTIAGDSNLKPIEKMVKIAETMSGTYIGKNGNVIIGRSAGNRTLLSAKGIVNGQKFNTIDLNPKQIISLLSNLI